MSKRGHVSYTRREFRAQFRHFLRQRWRQFGAAYAVLLATTVIPMVLLFIERTLLSAFIAGAVLGCALTMMWAGTVILFLMSGRFRLLQGSWGEDLTGDELAGAKKRGLIYGWVANVELDGRDIDHLIVAPFGVVAIETKFSTVALTPTVAARFASQAEQGARRAQSVLRSKHIGRPHAVTPLVAVWATPATRDELHSFGPLIHGKELRAWLTSQEALDPISAADGRELLRLLQSFIDDYLNAKKAA